MGFLASPVIQANEPPSNFQIELCDLTLTDDNNDKWWHCYAAFEDYNTSYLSWQNEKNLVLAYIVGLVIQGTRNLSD